MKIAPFKDERYLSLNIFANNFIIDSLIIIEVIN